MNMNAPLWVPGQDIELNNEYPVPSAADLREMWQSYIQDGEVIDAPDVYGVVRKPTGPVHGYASVDVCEVLRKTHEGMYRVEKPERTPLESIHKYGDGLSISSTRDITSVLQVLMTNALIQPVEDIDDIADIMRKWRKDGIYVFANTSTLPGCEKGTIDFFNTYLSGCIDGILFPRNHDGTQPLTKGHAARNVAELFPGTDGRTVAVHIDDTPHHNVAFREQLATLPKSSIATFLPEYPTHYPADEGSEATPTPLEAFRAADRFFTANLPKPEAHILPPATETRRSKLINWLGRVIYK